MTRRVVLTHTDAPRSLNAGGAGSRGHWSKGYAEKRQWEGVWLAELLRQKPRVQRGASLCVCEATIRWRHRNRRDVTNYVPALVKPLADVLVKPTFILPDDTDEHFRFEGLTFEYPDEWEAGLSKAVTVVTLDLTYNP